jgi:hypothetical protein
MKLPNNKKLVAAKKETGFLLGIQQLTVIPNKKPGFWVLAFGFKARIAYS